MAASRQLGGNCRSFGSTVSRLSGGLPCIGDTLDDLVGRGYLGAISLLTIPSAFTDWPVAIEFLSNLLRSTHKLNYVSPLLRVQCCRVYFAICEPTAHRFAFSDSASLRFGQA